MNRIRTIRENGKEIPYEEWFANQQKKLSIRMMCAKTSAGLQAVLDEIEDLKIGHRLMTSNGHPERVLAHIAAEHAYK